MIKDVLTASVIKEYSDNNPDLNYSELARKIIKEGGLYQYNSFDSLRRTVSKQMQFLGKKSDLKKVKRLFFDIETSPNIGIFWKSGFSQTIIPEQIIKERSIICICYKWEGEEKVYSLTWDNKQNDKRMLQEFSKVIKEADEVVAHNGDKFDIKWFNTRCLFHNINILPKYKTLDTLKKAKFHFYFNSNKLDYIAKYLGVGAKIETGGLDLWKAVLLEQNHNALSRMVDYCKNDVVILEDVFHRLKPYIIQNTHHGMHAEGNVWDCPSCSSKKVLFIKNDFTAGGTLQRWMECEDCESNFKISDKSYKDFLKSKLNNNEN